MACAEHLRCLRKHWYGWRNLAVCLVVTKNYALFRVHIEIEFRETRREKVLDK
jgi:hypothetical protein